MNTPTPTPRADAATYPADCLGTTLVTKRDCSRALERDLTALTAEREQLRADAERLRSDRDCEKRIRKDAEELREDAIARAEKAERAETVALANWNGALERAMKAEADLAAATERLRSEAMDDYASIKDLQRELATERARLDWVFRNCKVTADDFTTGNRDVYAIHDREDLGAAMKEDAK